MTFAVMDGDPAAHGAIGASVGGNAGVVEPLAVDLPGIWMLGLAEVPHRKAGHFVAELQDAGRVLLDQPVS